MMLNNLKKRNREKNSVLSISLLIIMVSANLWIIFDLSPSTIIRPAEVRSSLTGIINSYLSVFEDLGIEPNTEVIPDSYYEILGKLRDNENSYMQVWTPWISKGALHVAKVSDDGEFLVLGGGYLLDTELHIYRWNPIEREYVKVWEVGSGIITRDVYDIALGDSDNNDLIEIAAVSADGRVYLFEQAHISDPIANLENRFDYVWRSEWFYQATAVEFMDLDLDGVQDLIVGSWDQKIHIFEYTSHSGYPFSIDHWIELTEKWTSTLLDDKIQSLGVGDINNNGLPDFVVGTISGSVYVFENDGVLMSPYGIEFPFPNDDNYKQIWTNTGVYQPIWNPIGQIAMGDLDNNDGTDAVVLAWGQGAWILRYNALKGFYLEQLTQAFESWQMQGAYPLDNFADWMVRDANLNNQVYYQHSNGTKYPEPWGFNAQNEFDIFANSAATGEPYNALPPPPYHGGTMFNGHEYKIGPAGLTWFDAKAACEEMGGHLVTITSLSEERFLMSLIEDKNVWIGLTDENSEGVNKWVTGEDFPGEPGYQITYIQYQGTLEDYYIIEAYTYANNGYWRDAEYDWGPYYYVCEWDTEPLYLPTPHGGVMFEGNEYKYIKTPLPWNEARDYCASLGGHLVTISSKQEHDFVYSLTSISWIGLTDEGREGTFRWVTGEPVTFTNWASPNPNGEDYVVAWGSYVGPNGNFGWNDLSNVGYSGYGYNFVCEWENNRGGSYYNGHQYSVIFPAKYWPEAEADCQSMGGHLVSITNEAENSFVANLVQQSSVDRAFIGYNKINSTEWAWTTFEEVSYSNLVESGDGRVAEIFDYGGWNDLNGESLHTRAYICEWDNYFDTTKYDFTHDSVATTFYTRNTPQIQNPRTQHGGVMFNNHEYKFYQTSIYNWTEAQAVCESMGGHLVTITTEEENTFVSSLTMGLDPYIGFTDIFEEGIWQWVTEENNTYQNWMSDQPNGGTTENYAFIYDIGTWGDTSGSVPYGYICEWDYNVTIHNYLPYATGTWNLGKGEELASNGNEEPDVYIIFSSGQITDPSEWIVSLSNNLINWYQVNSSEIKALDTAYGLAVDVDPLFAVKKLMSAQYIQLTLLQGNETSPKARCVNAIVHPFVARPLTLATSVTIDSLSFEYNEMYPTQKIVFGGTDGRIIAFKCESNNISYYKKFSNKPAELIEIPTEILGLTVPSFTQVWDSYTDDFWNLGETIWSIQSTSKNTIIPTWRYEEGATTELSFGISIHHMTATEIIPDSYDYEFVITRPDQDFLFILSPDGTLYTDTSTEVINRFGTINSYTAYDNKILTTVFADITDAPGNELIIFPWYKFFKNPTTTDMNLMPRIWKQSGVLYSNPEVLWDVDKNLYNFLQYSTTYPSATAADMDNDSDIDLIISNGKLAMLWNIGSVNSPLWKLDVDYFSELNSNAPPEPIFSPNVWDYDSDGDYDITYSYGRNSIGFPHNGHEYNVFTTAMNWGSAKIACEDMGGHLVTIGDDNENTFVRNLALLAGTTAVWSGLTDSEAFGGSEYYVGKTDGGGFVWITGEPLTYTNWVTGEPNDGGGSGEDWGGLYVTGTNTGKWNDWSSSTVLPYVCEWEPENMDIRYGMDFFENKRSNENPRWERNAYVMKNPTIEGSLRFNYYTNGLIIPTSSSDTTADSFWVYNPVERHLRQLKAEINQQSSYIIGTNPELMKIDVDLAQSFPDAINYGYSTLKSWSNIGELEEWTLTVSTSLNLDGDNNGEIVISDWDNNVYIFEHLAENTYKRAWKSQDLNHTIETDYSPYAFQDLIGISGEFQKTIFDHGNLLVTGFDYDKDGNEEFLVTAALTVYVFEATGYNDEYQLIFEKDYQKYIDSSATEEFTAIAVTPDFDQRGPLIALAANELLFLLRSDSQFGWIESFQSITGEGFSAVPGASTRDFEGELPIHGGVMFEGNEYLMFSEAPISWEEAKAACEAMGGHLVTITSEEENIFVSSLTNGWDPYIGFTDIETEGIWQWITGEDTVYQNWDSVWGEPNGGTAENYGKIFDNGLWGDTSSTSGYICEWERKTGFFLQIQTLLFADMNQDENTELWMGGINNTMLGKKGFLLSLDSNYGDIHSVYMFPAISTTVNALETADADYDGYLEFIIAHEHGLDIWEVTTGNGFAFTLLTYISSDPNYNQNTTVSPGFDMIQAPIELAPRSNDILHLSNNQYFSVYGLEDANHNISTYYETTFQNLANGEGNLYYSVSTTPQSLGTIQNQTLQLTNWPLVITEVYYEDDLNPGDQRYQWVELYNPNSFIIELTDWSLQSSTQTYSLSSNIQPNGYFIIYSDLTTYTSKWPAHPANLPRTLTLSTNDFLRLRYKGHEIDYVSWGGGNFWDISANGTSLDRVQNLGYLESIVPKDTNTYIDWRNTTVNGDPGHGSFSASSVVQGYECRPALIQNDKDIITAAWIVFYLSSGNVYTRAIYIKQFDKFGNPITSHFQIDNRTNTFGATGDPDYYVRFEDVSILDLEGNILITYVINDYSSSIPSGISGKVNAKFINTTDWTISDISNNLGIDLNYKINSLCLVKLQNRIGIVFSGLSRVTFESYHRIYLSFLNSSFHNQGITSILSGKGDYRFPDVSIQPNNPNEVSLICEHVLGGKYGIISIFSSNGGESWSEQYELSSDDPYLHQESFGLFIDNYAPVTRRRVFRPRVTSDNTGGIFYQFGASFLLRPDHDSSYTGDTVTYDYSSYILITQLWIGNLVSGSWFKYNGISNVRDIAIGDTDNDLLTEIFISHDYHVTLLEISQDLFGIVSYVQKWQYESPLFISLNPEQLNNSGVWLEYASAQGEMFHRETGGVAIADTNGNGWPELIFSVKGGDVFAFELKNLNQPINDDYFITQYQNSQDVDLTNTTSHLLITEVMYDPESPNEDAIWVEIYNPTESTILLNSYELSNLLTSYPLSGFILGNNYCLIVKNLALFNSLYPSVPGTVTVLEIPTLEFNIISDILSLDYGATTIDSLVWGSGSFDYVLSAHNTTLRRLMLYDTDSTTDWEDSETFGSPGSDPFYFELPQVIEDVLIDLDNDGDFDHLLADAKNGRGLTAWDDINSKQLWVKPVPGKIIDLFCISNEIILAISTKGIMTLNLDGTLRYWISSKSPNLLNSYLFVDLDKDGKNELILATDSDIRAILLNASDSTSAILWSNSNLDPQALGYFDISKYCFGESIFFGVSSSDFSTYRKINVLDSNGVLLNSFLLSKSHAAENLTNLVKFDTNSRSKIGDFDGNGQIDIILAILDNYDENNPQSRIEAWNIETLDLMLNLTIPIVTGCAIRSFQMMSYDTNNDSIDDIILSIPQFRNVDFGGILALDVASQGSILWRRNFMDTLFKVKQYSILPHGKIILEAYTNNSGVFSLTKKGSDILWLPGDTNTVAVNIFLEESQTAILVTHSNGTIKTHEVIGILSSAYNKIIEFPNLLTPTTLLYTGEPIITPVQVSNDETEKLLIAYKNGTLILRTLEKELWRILLDDFSDISATGLSLNKLTKRYALAFKTDTGNLIILDRISTTVLTSKYTEAKILTAINLGKNNDYLLMHEYYDSQSIISLYDPVSNAFIWNYLNPTKLITIEPISIDPSLPGIFSHLLAVDLNGDALLIELPNTSIDGGSLPKPSLGTKWIFVKTLENVNKLSEVFLYSDNSQIMHYSWNIDGLTVLTHDLPLMNVLGWDIVKDSSIYNILLSTENNGVIIYQENSTGQIETTPIHEEMNYYIGSSDNQFLNIDNVGEKELVLAVGSTIVIKNLSTNTIIKIFSFPNMVKTISSCTIDTTNIPILLVMLADGSLAIADSIDRKVNTGSAVEIEDLIFNIPVTVSNPIDPGINQNILFRYQSVIFVIILIITLAIDIIRRKGLQKPILRRLEP